MILPGISPHHAASMESAFEISVVPGWNLISFPRPLTDSTLDAVFSSSPNVTSIVTFASEGAGAIECSPPVEPSVDCLVSNKIGGTFTGTVPPIAPNKAYWVLSDSFGPDISVLLVDPLVAGSPWPVSVEPGYNLVPVRSLDNLPTSGTALDADTLFGDVSWSKAISFTTSTNTFEQVTPGTSGTVKVGKGVWLFVSDPGSLYSSLGVPPTPTSTPVPGLTSWGLGLLAAGFIAFLGIVMLRRKVAA